MNANIDMILLICMMLNAHLHCRALSRQSTKVHDIHKADGDVIKDSGRYVVMATIGYTRR